MALLLDAVERAGARGAVSRAAVVAEMFRTKGRESPLGSYSIDSDGDTSITDYGVYRIDGRRVVFDRVVDASP
jgi:branched-chain amino acid transport system substrate-binding protein